MNLLAHSSVCNSDLYITNKCLIHSKHTQNMLVLKQKTN